MQRTTVAELHALINRAGATIFLVLWVAGSSWAFTEGRYALGLILTGVGMVTSSSIWGFPLGRSWLEEALAGCLIILGVVTIVSVVLQVTYGLIPVAGFLAFWVAGVSVRFATVYREWRGSPIREETD
jgi:hypothetical protein